MHDDFHKKLEDRVEELEEQIHKLEKDLIHDSLTGLKTRAFFEEEASVFLHSVVPLEAGKRREWFGFKTLSFVLFEVDKLKEINDEYGQATPDEILKEVSTLINRSVREGDTVARWSESKIVACLLGANEQDAKEKAQGIRKSIEKITFTNDVINVTLSVGVATNWKGATFEEMIRRVEEALNKAKETKNTVVTYSELK